jgi:hypothetical protein
MPATWLADVLRGAGLAVDESKVPNWRQRGHTDGPTLDAPVGVLGHHTAGPATGDLPSFGTVLNGRSDLAGPLANLMLSRSGVFVPIAAGRAWHAGAGSCPWVPHNDGNGYLIGIEAESAGTGDWTDAQLSAYPRGVAALLSHLGAGADRFLGHKEWAPGRKPDPAGWPGDMAGFRSAVSGWQLGLSNGGAGQSVPAPAPAIPPVPGLPAWSLPRGHYYGLITGPAASHGGYYASERPAIQAIQRRLIAKGYVPGISDWRSGWADGRFEQPTADAVTRFQRAEMPGTTFYGQVWSDDYARLAR